MSEQGPQGRRSAVGGWLSGPGSLPGADQQVRVPGVRLGRPAAGSGSVASFGRRLIAVAIDWAVCMLIARAFFGTRPFDTLLVFAAENLLLVGTIGSTLGHRLLGLRVERVAGGYPGPVRALVRSLLLCLAFPALIWDADQRGLHDKAAGTLVARN